MNAKANNRLPGARPKVSSPPAADVRQKKMNVKILFAFLALALLMYGGCRREDTTPEQRRFQHIAQKALPDRISPAGNPLFHLVAMTELEAGSKLVATDYIDLQTNTLIYVTTQRCTYASREETPDRHSPGRPLYFDLTIIPLSNSESPFRIWEGTTIKSFEVFDPTGNQIKPSLISF